MPWILGHRIVLLDPVIGGFDTWIVGFDASEDHALQTGVGHRAVAA